MAAPTALWGIDWRPSDGEAVTRRRDRSVYYGFCTIMPYGNDYLASCIASHHFPQCLFSSSYRIFRREFFLVLSAYPPFTWDFLSPYLHLVSWTFSVFFFSFFCFAKLGTCDKGLTSDSKHSTGRLIEHNANHFYYTPSPSSRPGAVALFWR